MTEQGNPPLVSRSMDSDSQPSPGSLHLQLEPPPASNASTQEPRLGTAPAGDTAAQLERVNDMKGEVNEMFGVWSQPLPSADKLSSDPARTDFGVAVAELTARPGPTPQMALHAGGAKVSRPAHLAQEAAETPPQHDSRSGASRHAADTKVGVVYHDGHIQTTFKDGIVKTILSPRGVVSQAPAASDDRASRSLPYETQLPLAARAGSQSPTPDPRLPHTKAAAAHNRKLADLALAAAKMAGEGHSATPTPDNASPQRIPYLPASTPGPLAHHAGDDSEMRSRAADDAPQILNSPLPSLGEESRPPASVPTPDVVTRIGDMGNGEGVHVPTMPQKSQAGVPRPSTAPRRSLSPPEREARVQIPAFQVSAGVTAPSSTSVPPPALPQPESGESNADLALPTFAGASLSSKETGAAGATWPPRQFQGELQNADANTESDKSKSRPAGGTAPESAGRTYNKSPLPTVLATSSPKPMAERMRIRHQRHASAPDEVPADLDVREGRSSFGDQFKSESDFLSPLTQESDGDLASHSSEIGHFRKPETVDRTSTSGAIMRARIKELEDKLKSVTKAYDVRISDLIAEREAVERACVLNATTASWLESEHESMQAQLSRLEMTSSKKIFTLESTLEKISLQVQPALEALENKCHEMHRALASKDEAILAKSSEFFAEIAVKNESISSLEKSHELELEKLRTQCAAEIASKNVSISDLERHRTENEAMIKQQESKLKQQEKLAAKVVTLEEENARLSDEMSATRKVIQESSAKYDFKVTSLQEQLAEAEKAKIELENHDGALRSKLAQKQTQINELLKENAHMRADLQEAGANERSEVQKMRDEIRQLEQVKKEHDSLQIEHEDLQRQTSQLREVHERMQKENAGLEESRNRALRSGQVSSEGSQIPRLPAAFFAQNYSATRTPITPEREAKFASSMNDIRGVNSYLIEQCRDLVTRIKSSMFDDSEGKVERGCAGSFQQLDMVLSQLGVSLNKMEEAISPDKSHSASLAAAAESQVLRARLLADTLQARLNALESERQPSTETDSERRMHLQAGSDFDVPSEHREADRMHQGILAQVSDIGANLEQATTRIERFKSSEVQKRMNFSSFQDFLFQEKDNEIAALKNDLKAHQAKEIAMGWETEDKIRMAVAEVEESYEDTVSKLQAELKRFAVVIA